MFKHILVPLDGSSHSAKAAELAIELAHTYGAELTLLHVSPKLDLPDQLREYMKAEKLSGLDMFAVDEAAKRVIEDIRLTAGSREIEKVKVVYREGRPARSIVSYAETSDIDAIVMGSRGLSDLESMLLGSVSHKVTRPKCTVIIVK